MRAASTSATAQAKACSRMRGANSNRRSTGSFLESSNPTMRRGGFKTPAAATTGRKSDPPPASPTPAIRSHPRCRASRSYREEQSRPPIGRRFYQSDENKKGPKPSRPFSIQISFCGGLGLRDFGDFDHSLHSLDPRGFTLTSAQIIQFSPAHPALTHHINRRNHG